LALLGSHFATETSLTTRGESDICNGNDGCMVAIKIKILLALRNQDGTPNEIQENFDWKILLVYSDKFIIFDTD